MLQVLKQGKKEEEEEKKKKKERSLSANIEQQQRLSEGICSVMEKAHCFSAGGELRPRPTLPEGAAGTAVGRVHTT